ncbi:BTB domain-containing protein [Favolaschia claudopus]|uniref:BTB domain-containing protein n=1 Tax=Favolaschia claudopus TaxID=2862362 RepID=A0AAW0C4X0_9AGAR
MNSTIVQQSTSKAAQHPIFWLDDASLVLEVEDTMFKVHRTLLARRSPFITDSVKRTQTSHDSLDTANGGLDHVKIDPSLKVSALDLEILLQHFYHDMPLSSDSEFPQIASIIRVSSPEQLHFPQIHESALRYLTNLFPSGPVPFLHPPHLEAALALATAFNVTSIQKGLLYSLVTSATFDTEGAISQDTNQDLSDSESVGGHHVQGNTDPSTTSAAGPGLAVADSPSGAHKHMLSPLDSQRCTRLMTHLIDYFSPILFTPPATRHMACTDVFAETWMKLVIQPAIDDEGVYKPLETLERIKNVPWATVGLCGECILEKNAEWTEEQETIWKLMDQWV